jgi:chlorobactene glucosyltransferase
VLLFVLDALATLLLLPLARAMWDLHSALVQVPVVDAPEAGPLVSVIVPARNEERVIERCVRSLLNQQYPSYEILALNDRSTDKTGEILSRLAAQDDRLRVIQGEALPDGWVGKCWAVHQAACLARGAWLLFVDADTRHSPAMLAASVSYAEQHGVDLLTLGPHQELGTFWERAILPAIFGAVMTAGGSIADVNSPLRPHAKAIGHFMLFRAEVYRRLGGHESVRDEIVDDFAFARRIKGTGHRLLMADGQNLVSTRMYHSLREIWEGFGKNSYAEARRQPGGVVSAIALLWVVVVGSPLLLARLLSRASRGLGLSWLERASLLQGALRCSVLLGFSLQLTRLTRLPLGWALAVPPGLLFLSLVIANSAVRVLSGRGVTWKGRTYDLAGSE